MTGEGRDDLRLRDRCPAGRLLGSALPAVLRRARDRRRRRRRVRGRARRDRQDERPVPHRRHHRLRGHDREAGFTIDNPNATGSCACGARSTDRAAPSRRRCTAAAAVTDPARPGRHCGRVRPSPSAAVRIAVTGSIATDHLMTFPGRFVEQLHRRQDGPAYRCPSSSIGWRSGAAGWPRTSRSAWACSDSGRCSSARSALISARTATGSASMAWTAAGVRESTAPAHRPLRLHHRPRRQPDRLASTRVR